MNTISLFEIIESVAPHVPIPEDWDHDFFLHDVMVSSMTSSILQPSPAKRKLRAGFLNGLFLAAYRDSQAAGALDFYLDRAIEVGPSWIDWSQTGWPKVSVSARVDGLTILAHMSRYFERYKAAYFLRKFDNWPETTEIQSREGKFKTPTDYARINEIGFDRIEIIEFLCKNNIPNSLNDSLNLTDEIEPSEPIENPDNNPKNEQQDLNTRSKIKRKPGKVAILAKNIRKAQAEAGADRNNAQIVYAILIKMAELGSPPMIQFVEGKGIQFHKGEHKPYYHYSTLEKYLNSSARLNDEF